MLLSEDVFLSIAKDRTAGVLPREKALGFIKERGLLKVTLGSFYHEDKLYLTLGHQNSWAWDTTLISRELNPYNICLNLKKLEFYAVVAKSFPLFILKEGWGRAVVVCPTEFEEI